MRRETRSLPSSWRQTRATIPALTAATNASARRTLPRLATALRRELRRALRDQGFRLPDESAVFHAAFEDDLTAAAERVRDGSLVGDRQLLAVALAVGDEEGDPFAAVVLDRAPDHFPGHLIGAAGGTGR